MTDTLIVFSDAQTGATVYLPGKNIAHWTLSRMGALTLVSTSGHALHPSDVPHALGQLEALGLLPGAGERREARRASEKPPRKKSA